MSKSFDHLSQEKDAPILRIAASDKSEHLDRMLLQGRSMSGHERNCCFLNTLSSDQAEGRFATVSAVSGLDFDDDGQAAAQVDWDHDGDVDLVLSNRNAPRVRIMRNENPAGNRFLQLHLQGNGQDTNRNAIGARVTVTLDSLDAAGQPVRLLKTLRAGEGYLTQSSQILHFGLGDQANIQSVHVRWPNQDLDSQLFTDLQPNQRYRLVQGSQAAEPVSLQRPGLAIEAEPTQVPTPDLTMRIPLMHQFLAPDLRYEDFQGQIRDFARDSRHKVLVNLWSTTCVPCVKELTEFGERYEELKQAGVQVLALNIDQLQSLPEARTEAEKMAQRMRLPFTTGMAPPEVIAELQRLHNALIRMNRPLPMPSSFLIDRNGRLDIIYKGAVSVDTLLADAQPIGDMDLLDRYVRSVPFQGALLRDPLIKGPMERNEASALIRLGKEYVKEGQLDRAEATFLDALQQVPDSAAIHNQLALVYERQSRRGTPGKDQLAMKHYRDAIALDPDKPGLRINLAQMLIRNRQYEEAAEHLDHALAHAPEHADAHYNRGLIYSAAKALDQEKASYEKALEIRPDHPQALFRLGKIYEDNGQLTEAQVFYQRAVDQAPQSDLLLTTLARVLTKQQELEAARDLLLQVIGRQPRFPDAHFQLGQVYLASGDPTEARREFLETLRLNRNHQGAIMALQQLQLSAGSGQ